MPTLQSLEVLNAIYERRAVRRYKAEPVPRAAIEELLNAAIQAPSSMNEQPWAFAVVEGRDRLKAYSDRAKGYLLHFLDGPFPHPTPWLGPDVNIFHEAPALIVICATSGDRQAAEDCCLAAQNLMLAAFARGLGTCPIGFARPWLSRADTKRELGIPTEWHPVIPLVIGKSDEEPASPNRRSPRIVWSEDVR
jgi:nitroreductase